MLLINVRQIKTHYSKVIGNEIIIRHVIELGVETKLEEGQRDRPAVPAIFCQGQQGAGGASAVRTGVGDTPTPARKPGAGWRQESSSENEWAASISIVAEAGRTLGTGT